MSEKEIIKLAKQTRDAQKRYFTTRARYDRTISKSLERELDKAIEQYEEENPQLLIDLFDDESN